MGYQFINIYRNWLFAFPLIFSSGFPEAALTYQHHTDICHLPAGSAGANPRVFWLQLCGPELLPCLLAGRPCTSPSTLRQHGCPWSCRGCQNSEGEKTGRMEHSGQMRSTACCDTRLQSFTTALCGSCSTIIQQE